MNKHFAQALNDLLPLKRTGGLYVAYRSHRDLYTDILEYSFVIGHEPKKEGYGLQEFLSAHVRMADAVSIFDQMMQMHRSNPDVDAVDIQK